MTIERALKHDLIELNSIFNLILASETGEIPDLLDDRIRKLSDSSATKVDTIEEVNRFLDEQAEAFKERAKFFDAMAKRLILARERVDQVLKEIIVQRKGEPIRGNFFEITMQRGGSSVQICEDAPIPPQYQRQKVVVTPDKIALKSALESGEKIAGVYLEDFHVIRVRPITSLKIERKNPNDERVQKSRKKSGKS